MSKSKAATQEAGARTPGTESPRFDIKRPVENLEQSLKDVEELLSFHEKADKPAKGRPTKDHATLKRAAVVLIYAAWESFFENLIEEVVRAHAALDDVSILPPAVQQMLVNDLRSTVNRKGASNADVLTDTFGYRWQDRLVALAHREIYGVNGTEDEEATYGINLADPDSVTRLLKKYCREDLFATVYWAGMSNKQVVAKLSRIVWLRGSIAHTGKLPDDTSLTLAEVRQFAEFVDRVARKLVDRVESALASPPAATP